MKSILFLNMNLFCFLLSAKPFRGGQTPNDTLKSVRVLKESMVSLSIYAPDANEVTVSRYFKTDTIKRR